MNSSAPRPYPALRIVRLLLRAHSRAFLFLFPRQNMPVIHIDDLTDQDKLKMEVEQLKKEVKLQRQLVSKMCEEITLYIEGRSGEDPLVKGVPEDKNPFKERSSCVVA